MGEEERGSSPVIVAHRHHPGTSSSDSDVQLTIPEDAKVKNSVIDGSPGLKHCYQWNTHLDCFELEPELGIQLIAS